MSFKRAAVIGGGSFGTVVANIMADNDIKTVQWMRNAKTAESINTLHENPKYLPGVKLNPSLTATTDISASIVDADIIVISVPSQSVREVIQSIASEIKPHQVLLSTTKGIKHERFLLMSQVIHEVCPENPVAVLSGPNLAKEIARRELAGSVVACEDADIRREIQTEERSEEHTSEL